MCGCCSKVKHSFFVRKIISPIAIIVNIGLIIYFIVSNAQSYEQYKNRASYVIYHVSNTSSNYYIIRANLNDTANCSSNALFTFDVTTVYENIISKEGARNILFITVYWLSTVVAALLGLFDIVLAIMAHCIHDENDYEDFEENNPICYKIISSIGSQFLQKGSFLFPTYFIGIFDYTQLCLPHHTKESLFLLHHTYIDIVVSLCSMIYLILWTWACWDSERHQYGGNIIWVKYLRILTCDNEKASLVVLILLCLAVIPIGVYGIFVWVTSLMELVLTTKAVLISFNFLLGVVHDIVKLCKHY
jgi:hypothetical protein